MWQTKYFINDSCYFDLIVIMTMRYLVPRETLRWGWLRDHSCRVFAKQNAFKKWGRPTWEKWMSEQGRGGNTFGVIWILAEGNSGTDEVESDNLGTRARRPRIKETSHEGGQVACLYGHKSPNTAGANPGSGECPFPSSSTSLSCQIASCKQILLWTLDILLFWEVSLRVFHKRNRVQPFAKQISFSFNLFSKEWVPSIVPGWCLPQRNLARACSWDVHVKKTVYSMIRL